MQLVYRYTAALDFIDPDKLSMTVVLTAMNRFLNETDGLQMVGIRVFEMRRLRKNKQTDKQAFVSMPASVVFIL